MAACLTHFSPRTAYDWRLNEDKWFTRCLTKLRRRIAPWYVGRHFSSEARGAASISMCQLSALPLSHSSCCTPEADIFGCHPWLCHFALSGAASGEVVLVVVWRFRQLTLFLPCMPRGIIGPV